MKIRLKTWQIARSLLLLVSLPVLALTTLRTTNAQNITADIKAAEKTEFVCKGSHPTKKDFYTSARLLPPLTVTEIVDNRLEWLTAERGLELGSLHLEDGYSVVPTGFSREKHDGCYGVIYCERHKVVLNIDRVDPIQCGKK